MRSPLRWFRYRTALRLRRDRQQLVYARALIAGGRRVKLAAEAGDYAGAARLAFAQARVAKLHGDQPMVVKIERAASMFRMIAHEHAHRATDILDLAD